MGLLDQVIAVVAGWATAVVLALGLPGITLLMAIAAACVPLPSEAILPFAGYLASLGHFSILGIVIAAVIGENIGAAIAYQIGKRGARPFIARYGRWLLLDVHHLDLAERFFSRFGSAAVLIGRMLPIVRAFVALPAGLAQMNRVKFHVFTTIGSIVWCTALATIGERLGRAWNTDPRVHDAFRSAELVIVLVVVALIALIVWSKLRQRKT
ncbi:Alkaline phosphatase [Sphingomonas antarctica]|uniref:DedA family protein n=1 Tax=Sphingomonas antarctica TaxID=2040274 RepID=UPI0039ECF54F